MHDNHEGGAGDEDELQRPKACVGQREVKVVARVCAARLAGVAIKVLLVVAPDSFSSHDEDHDAKHKDDGEPDASEAGGIFIDPAEE
uniref:Uncharacterized protein n=1 Tax=Esox lucius TaxID=8010 RepID=A0A3P8ZE61_ESOLU